MNKSEPIFELFKTIRMEAMKTENWGLMRAVERAESTALEEICGVDLLRDLPARDLKTTSVFSDIPRIFRS